MPVGLITNSSSGGLVIVINANAQDVDIAALLDNPTGPVRYRLLIAAGVVVSGSNSTSPPIEARGLHESSVGIWSNLGKIHAAGGNGADGAPGTGIGGGGGGGGGAGNVPGSGGSGDPDGTNGADGTSGDPPGNGGAGGTTQFFTNLLVFPGTDGGDAVRLSHSVTISNGSGEIWGGGGGGAPGWFAAGRGGRDGGDGGDTATAGSLGTLLNPGDFTQTPGDAGFAIRLFGSGAVTWVDGDSDPNVKGTVG